MKGDSVRQLEEYEMTDIWIQKVAFTNGEIDIEMDRLADRRTNSLTVKIQSQNMAIRVLLSAFLLSRMTCY